MLGPEEVGAMSTLTPRPRVQPEPPVRRTPKETLEAPRSRWPTVVIGAVALLVGLGLGNAITGVNRGELTDAMDRLDVATERLRAAEQQIGLLSRRELAVAKERRAHNAAVNELDRVVVAGARVFADNPAPGDGSPGPRVTELVDDWLRATNTADVGALRALSTSDATTTFLAPFGLRREFSGDEHSVLFEEMGKPEMRLVGDPVRRGRFVWVGYDETDSSGVMVFRLEGGRIAHQWIVVARNSMGTW
jgi:hypothetical protein